jgi:Tfp pilus assembly protein PilE
MKTQRIEAYTLMEVAIAMLLAAVCISICYTAYGMVGDYFQAFQKRNAAAEEVLTLRRTMEKDILKGRYLIRSTDGIDIVGDSLGISYQFAEKAVLRKVKDLRTDSFHVAPVQTHFLFEGREALELDTVDQVNFMLQVAKQPTIPIALTKLYSAHDLLH